MKRGRCVIVGLGGFDPDVLANLALFYGACGYETKIADTPVDCDLLIIQRGTYTDVAFEVRADACHIYDYAAIGTSDLHQCFPLISTPVVIASGHGASGKTVPGRAIRSFHPVIPALWRADLSGAEIKPSFEFVHVGHRKPNPDGDERLRELDSIARSGACDFWGNGWKAAAPNGAHIHGDASLHQCQGIYRRARLALGVMYPFQRGRTISGRMWQAPLNGCTVISECSAPDIPLPGVFTCGDFMAVIKSPPPAARRAALIEECSEYWSAATTRLARELGLSYTPPSDLDVRLAYLKWIYSRHIKRRWPLPGAAMLIRA